MTDYLTDAALCATVGRCSDNRYDGQYEIELVRRYRSCVMRAKLLRVVERHRAPKCYNVIRFGRTPREILAFNKAWRDTR